MKKWLFTLLMIMLVVGLFGCSSKKADSKPSENKTPLETKTSTGSNGTPVKGGTIIVGTSSEPDSLDPHKTGEAAANIIMGNIGASLVYQDPKTKEFKPYLAKSWKTSADGKTWTFSLRQDVKFQDGSPLTAQDFVKTYERAKSTNFVASSDLKELKDVKAPDKYTLVLDLNDPFAPFLQYLSDPGWLQPLPAAEIAQGKDFSREPVGVGPF